MVFVIYQQQNIIRVSAARPGAEMSRSPAVSLTESFSFRIFLQELGKTYSKNVFFQELFTIFLDWMFIYRDCHSDRLNTGKSAPGVFHEDSTMSRCCQGGSKVIPKCVLKEFANSCG